MGGLSVKQHNPLRKRKAVTARAQGGHLCFAKEAIIKGQSDYLCVSADPRVLYPLSLFFLFPPHAHNIVYNVTGLEHIN